MKRALALTTLAACSAFAMTSTANATTPVGVCPAIGLSSDCSVVITIQANGSALVQTTGVGPFDGAEDSLVGIVNNGPVPLTILALSGFDIFGFDGDGLAAYGGGSFGPTGYEGPNTSFTVTDANHGFVNFLNGGILNGGTAYFSLEENLSNSGQPLIVGNGVPEPATWAMMLIGFGFVGGAMRIRRRKHSVSVSYA
jgi:hypothetical protein